EAGTVLQRSDGAQYTTDADVTIVGGVATAAVSASEAGADGDCLAATKLTLASPIAGVNSEATVDTGGITGGTDDEDEDSLHERLRNRVQYGVPNGRVGDYATWAREVSGVTRAWDYPLYLGGGTVGITFVLDDQVGSIIPDAAKVAEVQAYLEDRAPVDCTPTVFAPVAVPLDFTVSLTPDTAAVRAAVEAELEDLILRKAAPGGTIYISQINEAISLAEGETDHSLTAPAADVAHGFGEIAVMGAITWA
ncbi:MAG: baseplate J/gp47 family protein, partial [Deltaproteobacteria bacterium]|nr:baseplate J/gp47 family protein [Deltaproteobacteria bacterium]